MAADELKEIARVIAVKDDGVWLETIRKTSCGQCSLQKGCGQSVLQSLYKGSRHHMFLSTQDLHFKPELNDKLEIAIPDVAVLQGSLILYLVPMLSMLLAMSAAHQQGLAEGWVLLAGAVGMALTMFMIRLLSHTAKYQSKISPRIVRKIDGSQAYIKYTAVES